MYGYSILRCDFNFNAASLGIAGLGGDWQRVGCMAVVMRLVVLSFEASPSRWLSSIEQSLALSFHSCMRLGALKFFPDCLIEYCALEDVAFKARLLGGAIAILKLLGLHRNVYWKLNGVGSKVAA